MDIDITMKTISSLHKAVSGKTDGEVSLIFKQAEYGQVEQWIARIDGREKKANQHEIVLQLLLDEFKKELSSKIKHAETETNRLKEVYSQLGN